MTFEEWMRKNNYSLSGIDEQEAEFLIGEAWNYQQASIEGLKDELNCVRAYNDELLSELKQIKRPISDDQATCRTCGAPINDWYVQAIVKQRSSKWR